MTGLALLLVVPLLGAALVALSPSQRAKDLALLGTLAPVAVFAWMAWSFDWSRGAADVPGFVGAIDWFAPLNIRLSLGLDTVSMLMVGLTVLLGPICVLASYTAVTERVRTYYFWLLVLQTAMTGVFAARDVVVFYIFFEFTLVPLYILISLWGSTNRKAAATKFFLYTFTGSLVTLAGLVYVAYRHAQHNPWTFDFAALAETCAALPLAEQGLVFWALMCGFAVKVPLFPVHTWLPLAHTEAPTAGSVILAGVLLKLGTYGLYKFALNMCPAAAIHYAPVVGVLAVIGIVYAGLICWVQKDVKKLVAYSSVSHLGFCVLGLFALNSIGLSGSVLYMINHGLSTGALFLLIGMVYERYHTRSLKELGGLAAKMPVWSTFMVFFAMSSVGLPGLNGFVSEFMCLFAAFQADSYHWQGATGNLLPGATPGELGPWFGFFAGTGMIVTAMYILLMVGAVVWGPLKVPHGHDGHGHGHDSKQGHGAHAALPTDLCRREVVILAPLAVLCLVLGLYPRPLLHVLEAPTQQMAQMLDHERRTNPELNRSPEGVAGVPVVPASLPAAAANPH
ncbi:MAG: NADH-quinone oxidoreductase subunit M [Phycisphaeraceae bacterium]|nr:NADH-quinone oxidoreductase subunit M [Phycisphaeraceae bacterium]